MHNFVNLMKIMYVHKHSLSRECNRGPWSSVVHILKIRGEGTLALQVLRFVIIFCIMTVARCADDGPML